MRRLLLLIPALICLSLSCADTPDKEEVIEIRSSDPFDYCAAVGSIDKPGKGYQGPEIPRSVITSLKRQKVLTARSTVPPVFCHWRCMNKQVYACCIGANVPCNEKADINRTPTEAMNQYCEKNPGSSYIPAAITGRAMVWAWSCAGKQAVVGDQVFYVDQRGFPSDFWYRISRD